MSEKDRKHYAKIKADPILYAAYLARKRKERAVAPRYEKEAERKSKWRLSHAEHAQLLRNTNHAVERAIIDGLLVRATFCSKCGSQEDIQAHHRSYAPEHWLVVLWLCKFCHNKEHYPPEHVAETER